MFRSTKGASKARRDMINGEICNMRDMLPLPESARQRLSQLQIMSLSCCFIRKSNYFGRWLAQHGPSSEAFPFEFSQSMTGFMLITTREGKLLYISENVTEYLGHSMVDMMTQGDSIYDIIDKKDHAAVQAQLLQNNYGASQSKRSFFCRMNVSRAFRRQSGIGDHKVMHVKGHFVQPAMADQYGGQPVFMALCTPLITPDLKETIIQNHTMVFHSVHGLDMKYMEMALNGVFHLGYPENSLQGKSWYEFIHPEDIHEAKDKHLQLIKSSHEMGCMLTVRMMTAYGRWVWVNVVMHVRQPYVSDNNDPAIVCINQVIDEEDAQAYRLQSHLHSSHIARSPEFLPSGGSSPISIHQVTVDRDQMFPYGDVSGALETTYYGEFGFTVSPAPPTTTTATESPSFSNSETPVTTYSALAGSPVVAGQNGSRKILKAEIINRLKRKMADLGNQQACRPSKLPKYGEDFTNDSSGGLVLRSAALHNSYSVRVGGSAQEGVMSVVNRPVEGPTMMALKSKPAELPDLDRLPTMVLNSSISVDSTLPPTPMTPDSIQNGHDTTTTLTIDTTEIATVPPSMPTPEASPVSQANAEFEACSPAQAISSEVPTSVMSDADALSLFPEVEIKKQVKPPEPKKVKELRPLPVLDLGSVQDYFQNLEPYGQKKIKAIQKSVEKRFTVSSPPPQQLIQQHVRPQPVPASCVQSTATTAATYSNNNLVATPTSDLAHISYDQLSALINQFTDAVLGCVNTLDQQQQLQQQPESISEQLIQASRTPSPAVASPEASTSDVTGEFMVVPDITPSAMETTSDTRDAVLPLDYDLLAEMTMETQPRFPSQASILDELYQLNFTLPSNGNGDQTNPSC